MSEAISKVCDGSPADSSSRILGVSAGGFPNQAFFVNCVTFRSCVAQ